MSCVSVIGANTTPICHVCRCRLFFTSVSFETDSRPIRGVGGGYVPLVLAGRTRLAHATCQETAESEAATETLPDVAYGVTREPCLCGRLVEFPCPEACEVWRDDRDPANIRLLPLHAQCVARCISVVGPQNVLTDRAVVDLALCGIGKDVSKTSEAIRVLGPGFSVVGSTHALPYNIIVPLELDTAVRLYREGLEAMLPAWLRRNRGLIRVIPNADITSPGTLADLIARLVAHLRGAELQREAHVRAYETLTDPLGARNLIQVDDPTGLAMKSLQSMYAVKRRDQRPAVEFQWHPWYSDPMSRGAHSNTKGTVVATGFVFIDRLQPFVPQWDLRQLTTREP